MISVAGESLGNTADQPPRPPAAAFDMNGSPHPAKTSAKIVNSDIRRHFFNISSQPLFNQSF
jgi:hypothetical protein